MNDTQSPFLTVRGRPVEFRPSKLFGSLHAVERGPFPVSPTGYRSLAGHFGQFGPGRPEDIPADFLESIAKGYDKDRDALRSRLRRAPRDGGFITMSMAAEMALDHGFFAPQEERVTLWQEAYRTLCLIDMHTRFQPQPYSAAWTPEHCAKSLAEQRALLAFVRQLATGSFPAEAPRKLAGAKAYFALPPKPEGEAGFILPGIASEFAFVLSGPEASDGEDSEDDGDGEETWEADHAESDEEAENEDPAAPIGHPAPPPQTTPAVQLDLF